MLRSHNHRQVRGHDRHTVGKQDPGPEALRLARPEQAPPGRSVVRPFREAHRDCGARVLQEGGGQRHGGLPQPPGAAGHPHRRPGSHQGLLRQGGVPAPRAQEEGRQPPGRYGVHRRVRAQGAGPELPEHHQRHAAHPGEGVHAEAVQGDQEAGRRPVLLRRDRGQERLGHGGGRHAPAVRLPKQEEDHHTVPQRACARDDREGCGCQVPVSGLRSERAGRQG